MKSKRKSRFSVAGLLLLLLITVLFVYPFWWMMVNSLNTNAQVFGQPRMLPQAWRWQNYVEIFQKQPFARHYLNSLLVAAVGTLGNVFLSALAGYGFARTRFPGRGLLFLLLLTALMMPVEVIIIPLYYQMRAWNLTNSLIPLMLLPIFGSQGALSAFMFRQFFITVPVELEEAAKLDGLNHLGLFAHIMLPLAVPVASSAGILAFLNCWNTYLEPLVFTTSLEKYTLPLSLNNFNDVYGQPEWHLQLAATTLSVLPVMLVYLVFQEKVTDAMVHSGLKG